MAVQKLPYRAKGCGCDCANMPADPCQPCGGGAFQIQCRTRAGVATLCGYPEYTSPSIPPKKFRQKTFSGDVFAQIVMECGVDETVSRTHQSSFSGVNTYNAATCAVTKGSASTGTAAGHTGFDDINVFSFADSYVAIDGGHSSEAFTRTSKSVVYVPGTGCPPVCGTCCASRKPTCATAVETLSAEDKEEDAMARVAPVWSEWHGLIGCCTSKEARLAGDFTLSFVESEYRIRVAGAPGTPVNVKLTFTRTNGAPYEVLFQDIAQSPTFPANPEAGWTSTPITAKTGSETCLVKAEMYVS